MSAFGSSQVISDAYSGNILQNLAIAFIILETIFVCLRYLSRHLKGMPVGLDDFLILPGLIFNLALCCLSIAMVQYGGLGHHVDWVYVNNPTSLTTFAKLQVPFSIAWELAVAFPKLALLGLYLRIFVEPSQRISCYILIAVLVSFCVAQVIATLLQCIPLSYLWDPIGNPGGHCVNFNDFWRWGSFPNIVTDIFMLMLPLPCILKLQLSSKDKAGLVATFLMGSIGLITSIVRFVTFFETNSQVDPSWSSIKLGCMSILEAGVYLIAACLPTYRSLFRSARRRVGLSILGSRKGGGDTDPQLLTGPSRQANDGSIHEYGLKDGGRASKENSSVELNTYEAGKHIRVKHDFVVSTSRR